MLAFEETLILCGFKGDFGNYVTVFLFDKNVSKNAGGKKMRHLRRARIVYDFG